MLLIPRCYRPVVLAKEPTSTHPPEPVEPSWLGRFRELHLPTYIEKWRDRVRLHPETGLPLTPSREGRSNDGLSFEKLAFRSGAGLRLALRLFTPIAFALFVGSFFIPVDWLEKLVRAASIAALIGFGTNWVAIKMLFRPREVRPVFGQGLIPSQREELIRKVADEVVEKLINEEIIRRELDDSRLISRLTAETTTEVRRLVNDPEFAKDTKQVILTYAARFTQNEQFRSDVAREVEMRVEEVAGTRFAQSVVGRLQGLWREPVVRAVNRELDDLPNTLDRLVGDVDSALEHLPKYLERHQFAIDRALTRITMSLIREIDVHRVITKQLSTVTSDQLETNFREFADDKLGYITLLGGILGGVGGFVIIWPIYSILAIIALGLVLGALDIALHLLLSRASSSSERPGD